MAKVSYTLIPSGFEDLYRRAISPADRFVFSTVKRKSLFTSRKRKKGLTLKSQMPFASQLWSSLTNEEREAWASASLNSNQKPFQLFLRDVVIRLQEDLSTPGEPSDVFQYKVGRCRVEAPASGLRLVQEHPFTYYVLRKVQGSRDSYSPILITENFALPLQISMSWATQLEAITDFPDFVLDDVSALGVLSLGKNNLGTRIEFLLPAGLGVLSLGKNNIGIPKFSPASENEVRARLYVEVLSHYQGRDILTEFSLNFGLNDSWKRDSLTISEVLGFPKGYAVYIELQNVRGTLLFDNPRFYHSGQNWARDPRCDSVRSVFTRAFYQIPRHWAPEILPEGSDYNSVYGEVGFA